MSGGPRLLALLALVLAPACGAPGTKRSEPAWNVHVVVDGAARDGYWSWWLDGELGPGFAHLVSVHDGATVEWRYLLSDPDGRGAEPVARVACLSAAACAAIEAFGAGRNLVAHGETCRIAAHASLPRLSPTAPARSWSAVDAQCAVDAKAPIEGPRTLSFDPGEELSDWEALGDLCGRVGAARVAWNARRRGL